MRLLFDIVIVHYDDIQRKFQPNYCHGDVSLEWRNVADDDNDNDDDNS